MTGVIGVSEAPVSKPSRARPALKKRVFSHSRSISSGSDSSTSIAARQAAATAGGCEVEKRNGRARCSSMVAQDGRPGDVAAQHADRLGEGPDLDVHPAVQVEVVDAAAPVAAEHARSMRVVDVDDRLRLLGGLRRWPAAGRCRRPC